MQNTVLCSWHFSYYLLIELYASGKLKTNSLSKLRLCYKYIDSFSWNSWLVEVREGISGGHLVYPSNVKQGYLEQVAQDHVQMDFECLQSGRIHKLSGQPVSLLSHPHSKRSLSWCLDGTSCLSVCSPLPLVLSLGTAEKSLAPSSCAHSYMLRSPWAFSSLGWAVLTLSAFPRMWDAPVPSSSLWPFVELSPLCPCLSGTGVPSLDTALQVWPWQCWVERKDPPVCWQCSA